MRKVVCNKKGEPLLMQAAKAKLWEVINLLLEKGASATKRQNAECALCLRV